MKRFLAVLAFAVCCPIAANAGLIEYVKKPDASFKWSVAKKIEAETGTSYQLEMVSQTWQGIKWEHAIMVFVPKGVTPGETMMIYNEGGRPGFGSMALGFEIAKRAGIPLGFVYGIPNQPLYDGKKEDALIAETFVRYLKTGDEDWPLLFPMAKSIVRAMDALQAFSKDELKTELKTFVVSGASKRGWTSWMTGAVDPRVKAIAPLVIDTLNFGKQIPHQFKAFGKASEMVKDYTERGLIPIPEGEAAQKLWKMVDPWMYRDKLTMPKMIINGANDPYWTQDALNLYWDDLKGDKFVLYVPNAGHGLEQLQADGKKDRVRALSTLSYFAHQQALGKPMPKLNWKHDDADGQLRLTTTSDTKLKSARLWVADATSRDFRKSVWHEAPAKIDGMTVIGSVAKPEAGWRSFFMECEFEADGRTLFLSTQIRMEEAKK